jgi:hypothetical protein
VEVAPDGSLAVVGDSDAAPDCVFDEHAHAGLLAFVETAVARRAAAGAREGTGHGSAHARHRAARRRMPAPRAFRRAAAVTRAWSVAIEQLVEARLPDVGLVLFLDEPSLVSWRRDDAPLDREARSTCCRARWPRSTA